jgi:hypothetical protein
MLKQIDLPCALLALSLAGCSNSGSANEGGTDDESGGEDGEACLEEVFTPGPTALRRMTDTQYNNTVQDLFPGIEIPPQTILADPETHGFENFAEAQHASALLIEQYQKAALEVTEVAMWQSDNFLPCSIDGGGDPVGCGTTFLADFSERAFRRPVDASALGVYTALFEQQLGEHNFNVAIQLAMQAILQAPEFLYFFEFEGTPLEADQDIVALDDYAVASRLSYFLWDSMPDATLFAAAQAGELSTAEGIETQARRMLGELAARRSVVNFHRQWLDYDRIETINLDLATYPEYYWELNEELKEGLSRRIEHVIFDSSSTLNELLTSPDAWVNESLAGIYGVEPPSAGSWELRQLPAEQRAGLLTDAGWLSSRAHAVHPSPVQRGVFVLERLICLPPPPPPPDIDTNPPNDDQGQPQTNRERYEQHLSDDVCAACHAAIDGIGMGFEHYDSLGRWRDLDNGFEVDASGELLGTEVNGPFVGAVELADLLGQSQTVRDCVPTHYFQYALGRNEAAEDSCTLEALQAGFTESEGNIQELLISIVTSDAFRHRPAEVTP